MGRNEVVHLVINHSTLLRVIQRHTGVGCKHLQMILINAMCTGECDKRNALSQRFPRHLMAHLDK